jgi:hypothetical protein
MILTRRKATSRDHRAQRAQPSGDAAAIGPAFPIGGPSSASWREEMLAKAHELAGLKSWVQARIDAEAPAGGLFKAIDNQLETARLTAAGEDTRGGVEGGKKLAWWTRLRSSAGGAALERTLGNLDAAEVNLLRLAPLRYLEGQIPGLQAHVDRFLPKDDPRRLRVDNLVRKAETLEAADRDALIAADRDALIGAYHAANSQRRRDLIRLRSFRNLVAGGTLVLVVLAIVVAIIGASQPQWLPVCFLPEDEGQFVCPLSETPIPSGDPTAQDIDDFENETAVPQDVLIVELVGLVAAALAGAVALGDMRGTSTPYAVPVALILLKLPAGALTAVLGLLFMRGGFVPGLTALDTSAQILAWAVIFGYAQQVFTRLVDSQGHDLLDDVAGRGAAGDRSVKTR